MISHRHTDSHRHTQSVPLQHLYEFALWCIFSCFELFKCFLCITRRNCRLFLYLDLSVSVTKLFVWQMCLVIKVFLLYVKYWCSFFNFLRYLPKYKKKFSPFEQLYLYMFFFIFILASPAASATDLQILFCPFCRLDVSPEVQPTARLPSSPDSSLFFSAVSSISGQTPDPSQLGHESETQSSESPSVFSIYYTPTLSQVFTTLQTLHIIMTVISSLLPSFPIEAETLSKAQAGQRLLVWRVARK